MSHQLITLKPSLTARVTLWFESRLCAVCVCNLETHNADSSFQFRTEWVQQQNKGLFSLRDNSFYSHGDTLPSIKHVLLKIVLMLLPSSDIFSFFSHVTCPDLPFSFLSSRDAGWGDGACIALNESQLCQVRHATLTTAFCPFVK